MPTWVAIVLSIGQLAVLVLTLWATQAGRRRRRELDLEHEAREAREQGRTQAIQELQADLVRLRVVIDQLWAEKESKETCKLKHEHVCEEIGRLMRAAKLNGSK